MDISYEQAKLQTQAEDGQQVMAAFKNWTVSEKSLAQYQVVKRTAATKTLKAYRISKGLPLPTKEGSVKEEAKRNG